MNLWTFQPIEVWELLQQHRVLHVDKSKIRHDHFNAQYAWYNEQMAMRIPPRDKQISPWWAWHTYDGKRKRPDLRKYKSYLPNNSPTICIHLNIPDNQVLLSDFDDWHYALSGCYNPIDNDDSEAFDYFCESLGHSSCVWIIDMLASKYNIYPTHKPWPLCSSNRYTYPQEVFQRVTDSWERIFNMDPSVRYDEDGHVNIQATFWELRMEHVIKTETIIGRYTPNGEDN